MNTKVIKTNKVLSLLVAITMIATMVLPMSVFAATEPTITTDLNTKRLVIDETMEFTVTSEKNDGTQIVKGKFEVTADAGDFTLEYEESSTPEEDWYVIPNVDETPLVTGTFGPSTGFPVMDATSKFRVTFNTPGTYDIKVSLVDISTSAYVCYENIQVTVLDYADYSALNTAIATANALNEDDYTATSYAELKTAVESAEAFVAQPKVASDEQATVDAYTEAIINKRNALVKLKTVDFTAVAVADDASVNYAKATKIVMIFAEPIADGADILSNLSIKDKIQSAAWRDTANTVYELVLKSDANLSNGTKITYTTNDSIKTKTGYVLNTVSDIEVIGNLEEASALVTATKMAATIVKASDKPGVVAGDKIVFVFNAPIKDNPSTITIDGKTANAVTGTANTVYELTLDGTEGYTDASTFDYGSITDVPLNGTFGTAVAPRAMRAYAIDNDGTELVYNEIDGTVYKDQIVVVFDTPTNKANDISKISVLGAGYTASLGTKAELNWEDDGTKLVITLGQDTVIKNGATIDLTNLGIMDKYDIVSADSTTLELDIEGSFGYTTKPRITKAVAFTQGELDYIRIFFNTQVQVVREVGVTTGFSMTNIIREGLNTTVPGLTYYEFVMPKDGHGEFKSKQYTIALSGLADKDTGTIALDTTPIDIIGGFVSPITPEVLKVVAISNDGSGVAKKGDKIVAVFNTEVTIGNVEAVDGYLGAGSSVGYSSDAHNVVEITLGGADLNIQPGTTKIKFTGFMDEATKSVTMDKKTEKEVGGSFGKIIEPKALSITAISNDGSGVAKAGDKIVVVFNTDVIVKKINNDDVTETTGNVYTYTLTSDNQFKVGGDFVVTAVSVSNGREYTLNTDEDEQKVGGSFGWSEMPKVKSVVLSETEGKEIITVVFDRATNMQSISNATLETFRTNNTHLGKGATAMWKNDTVLEITLASDAITTNEMVLNLSGLGVKAKDTGTEITGIDALAIKGLLVPVVNDVRFAGKAIVLTFSTRTNGVANISNFTSLFGVGAKTEWSNYNRTLTITLGENYTIRNNGYVVLNGMGITDGFTGEHTVIGEYRVNGDIASDKVTVESVKAQSTNKANETAHKGDTIVIKFNSATDLKGFALNTPIAAADVDSFISVEGGNETAFGTGYTGIWTAYDRFVINLGGSTTEGEGESAVTTGVDPSITIDNIIKIKNVKFADGTGKMDDASIALTGSFDGREFLIKKNGNITAVGADCRVKASVEYIYGEKTPTIVCVAYKGTTVAGIMRMTLSINDKVEPVFEFANGADITSAKIFVFDDAFSDITASPEVLAKTIEITK